MGVGGTKTMIIQDPQNGSVQATVPKILFSEIKFSGCSLDDVIDGHQAMGGSFVSDAKKAARNSGIVGFGAAAVVRKGVWKGKEVAVKVYHPGYDTQEFIKEVSTLSALSHPAMVKLFGICVDSGRFGLVMEFAPLGSLEDYLRGRDEQAQVTVRSSPRTASGRNISDRKVVVNKRLEDASDWPLVFRFATDISAAMAYVHNQGFLHRDLKPSNILLSSFSEGDEVTAKLCDFGAGRRGAQEMTSIVGTVPYMAPEVLQSTSYTQAIDVYSFGIILWEIVTRGLPYDNMFLIDVVEFVTSGKRLHIPSYLPPPIRLLIERCWHQDPEMRPTFEKVHLYLKALAVDLFQLTLETMTQQLKIIDRLKEGYIHDSMTVSILERDLTLSNTSLASLEQRKQNKPQMTVPNQPIASEMLLGRVSSRRTLPLVVRQPVREEEEDEDDDEYDESDDSHSDNEEGESQLRNDIIRKQIEEKLDQGRQTDPSSLRPGSVELTERARQKEHIVVKKSKLVMDEKNKKKNNKNTKRKTADIGGGIRLKTGSSSAADIADKLNNAKISTSYSSLPTKSNSNSLPPLDTLKSPSLPDASSLGQLADERHTYEVTSLLEGRSSSTNAILGSSLPPSLAAKKKIVLSGALDTPFQTVSIQRDFAGAAPQNAPSHQ